MHFEERTIKVIIDEEKCLGCKTHACAQACKIFARGILVIKDGKPALGGDAEFGQQRVARSAWPVSMNAGSGATRRSPSKRPSRDWMSTGKNME